MKGLGFTSHWSLITRVLGVLIILLNTAQVRAQSGIEMDMSTSYKFGEQITFIGQIKTPVQIQSASIFIFNSLQSVAYTYPVFFDQNGRSEFRLDTGLNAMRPFTTFVWNYEITLVDGSTIQSQKSFFRYDDYRFQWRTLESAGVRVHWYNGDDQFGIAALNAAQAGLQSIRGFFAPDLTKPVDVFIYASESDLRGTLYNTEKWVVGHSDSPAGVVTVLVEPGPEQGIILEQRIPHELMHVLFYRQVGAGYEKVPAWLREGISMLAEVYPNPDYDNVLKDAAARDALIPMQDLCASFSPNLDSAFLAYAQSRSFTNYLRGQYGADGLLTLAKTYADGVDCDRGPERAFGVSFAKLETDWRASILGQSPLLATVERLVPYLVLLCLILIFPLIGIIGSLRKKGNAQ